MEKVKSAQTKIKKNVNNIITMKDVVMIIIIMSTRTHAVILIIIMSTVNHVDIVTTIIMNISMMRNSTTEVISTMKDAAMEIIQENENKFYPSLIKGFSI
jgi:hypothetical protein